MTALYVVVHKKNRTIRTFDTAESVAAFMLGRTFSDWSIYQRQDNLPTDVKLCRMTLEASERKGA
jgi:hypothetical protein